MSLLAEYVEYRAGGRTLLTGVSLQVQPGRVHALIGPNGAGKSTLLKILAGDLAPHAGSATLNGRALRDWPARELARLRAVLPQAENLRFAFSAAQVVELGRLASLRGNDASEQALILEALRWAGAETLAARSYPTLSGGERARVQFARVLAQIWQPGDAPRYLLLDEPTASLDLAHQHDCLAAARRFAATGAGILVVLHDPNLALTYADEVSLLCCSELVAGGAPGEVLNKRNLERVYGVQVDIIGAGAGRRGYIAVTGRA